MASKRFAVPTLMEPSRRSLVVLARPVTALREAFECVRHLLRGDRRPYRGQVFSLAGEEGLRWPVPRSDVPFLLGAWGRRVIHACAPHVDEIKVGGTASPGVARTILGEVGLLPFETAVHKMTGATARALRLADRGLLKEGFCADLAIFDPRAAFQVSALSTCTCQASLRRRR